MFNIFVVLLVPPMDTGMMRRTQWDQIINIVIIPIPIKMVYENILCLTANFTSLWLMGKTERTIRFVAIDALWHQNRLSSHNI